VTTYSEAPSGAIHILQGKTPFSLWRNGAGHGSVGAMRRLVPVLLILGSCVAPPKSTAPNPGPEIIRVLEVMYEDLSARRWELLAAHFLPDSSLVFATPAGPNRMTPAAFIEMVRKNVEGKEIFEEKMEAASVRAHGDVAQVWSSFAGREGSGTTIRTWGGVDAFTLVKSEGRWRIALVAVSPDPPEEPEKKE